MGLFYKYFTALAIVAALWPWAAPAAVDLPGAAEPGRVERELEAPALPVPEKVPEAVPHKEEAPPPVEPTGLGFALSAIVVDDSTIYTAADLLPYYEDFLNQRVDLNGLKSIAAAMTARYRNDGYILSRVIVPPQVVEDGIVHLQALEGRVANVNWRGAREKAINRLAAYARKITGESVINTRELERYLLLMNDLPGTDVAATLSPAQVPKAADLTLALARDPVNTRLAVDNWGTRYLGPLQFTGTMTFNALSLWGEQTTVRTVKTARSSELRFWELKQTWPLGHEGTSFLAQVRYSRSQPGSDLSGLDVKSRNSNVQLTLKHPFIRSREDNLYGWLSFEHQQSKVVSLGAKLSEDKLRMARLGVSYDGLDSWGGVNLARLELSYGLDVLRPTRLGDADVSRVRGRGTDFYKTTLDLARLQKLTEHSNLLAYATGQFATHALLAVEEMGFGGNSFGRGYDASEITGDQGAALKLELQHTPDLDVDWRWLTHVQFFAFYDFGVVFNKDHLATEPLEKTAASAGFGIRSRLFHGISGALEVGKPLTRSVKSQGENQKNANIYLRLVSEF